MSTRYECDRCHDQFGSKLDRMSIDDHKYPSEFDLCPKCAKALRVFILGVKKP